MTKLIISRKQNVNPRLKYWYLKIFNSADINKLGQSDYVIVQKLKNDYEIKFDIKNNLENYPNALIFKIPSGTSEIKNPGIETSIVIAAIVYKLMNWERGIKSKKGN